MSGGRLSETTKALLAAARADAPSRGARAKMWARVSSAAGGAAGVAAAGSAAAATGAGNAGGAANGASGAGGALAGGAGTAVAMKALSIGTLLGGTVTVGMAAILLHVGAARAPDTRPTAVVPVVAAIAAGANPRARTAADSEPTPRTPLAATDDPAAAARTDVVTAVRLAAGTFEESPVAPAPVAAAAPVPSVQPAHAARSRPVRRIEDSNSLSMETSLITQARTALEDGDALAALRKARAARSLPVRQLEPEALSVEAQALRALGRDSEASSVDRMLRAQYPESALAR